MRATPASKLTFCFQPSLAGDLADIGPGAIRLARTLRHVDHLAAEQFDQPVDRLRIAGAEVLHLADAIGFGRHQEGFGHVAGA